MPSACAETNRWSDHRGDPWLSIIIPVFREEQRIGPLLDHLKAQGMEQECEILVVDGDPQYRTLAVVDDSSVVRVRSDLGRAIQMNTGARKARGEALLFLHADTRLPPDASARIRQTLGDPAVVGGAFSLSIASTRPVLWLIAAVANLRTAWTRIPYGDQAFFLRREKFEDLGGFATIPVMEDLELMHRVRQKGWRIVILQAKVRTDARRWESEGILRCTFRNWTIRLLYHCGVPPERLKGSYRTQEQS